MSFQSSQSCPVASRVKKVWRQEVAIFVQTATNFGTRKDYGCHKVPLPPNFPKWKIISAKTAQNQQKLLFMEKIVRLCEHAKVAQKLRFARSQFSGGTNYRILQEICIVITEYSTSPQTRRYTPLWSINVVKLACSVCCGRLATRQRASGLWRVHLSASLPHHTEHASFLTLIFHKVV